MTLQAAAGVAAAVILGVGLMVFALLPGRVTIAEIVQEYDAEDEHYEYTLDFRYVCTVDGREYGGADVFFSLSKLIGGHEVFNHRAEAEERLEKYPLGSAATVYSNPSDPEDAVLERRLDRSLTLILLGFGLPSFVVGLVVFVVLLYVPSERLNLRRVFGDRMEVEFDFDVDLSP